MKIIKTRKMNKMIKAKKSNIKPNGTARSSLYLPRLKKYKNAMLDKLEVKFN